MKRKFKTKIDMIINENPYGITSVTGLETFSKLSNSTLVRAYNRNKEPAIRTVKKIMERLLISKNWWYHDVGDIFIVPTQDDSTLKMLVTEQAARLNEQVKYIEDCEYANDLDFALKQYIPFVPQAALANLTSGNYIVTGDNGLSKLMESKVRYKILAETANSQANRFRIKFLNPKTRAQHLKKLRLVVVE